jgi:REP element-mobilizing transposase RayT
VARPLRIEFPGALYHVTSRGNDRAPVFLVDSDRRQFLETLGEVVGRCGWRCHAYCLMTNHYHLLVETPRANLSAGMRHVNGLYTQRFNRRHERVGHVFQGRFHAVLVERETHFLELARYVVLNPVRAGLVRRAEDYRWSSLRASLGFEPIPSWLTPGELVRHFGSAARYLEFVREGIGRASPWESLRGGVLGSEAFARRVGALAEDHAADREIPRPERLMGRESLAQLFPSGVTANKRLRDRRIREASRICGYTLGEISAYLGLHYSTISKISKGRRADAAAGSGAAESSTWTEKGANSRPDPSVS